MGWEVRWGRNQGSDKSLIVGIILMRVRHLGNDRGGGGAGVWGGSGGEELEEGFVDPPHLVDRQVADLLRTEGKRAILRCRKSELHKKNIILSPKKSSWIFFAYNLDFPHGTSVKFTL